MYKNKINKGVGLLILAIAIFFGVNTNVLAINVTNNCNEASKAYNITLESHLNEARSYVTIKANTGSFNIKYLRLSEGSEKNIMNIIEKKLADKTFKVTTKDKDINISSSELASYGQDYSILVYSTDNKYCDAYYYKLFDISTRDEYKLGVSLMSPTGSVRSAYLNDIASGSGACGWANRTYNSSDDTIKGVLKKVMPSCFPDVNGNVVYNLSEANLNKLQSKVAEFITLYNKNSAIINKTDLPALDASKPWVRVNKASNFKSQYKSDLGSQSSEMLTCDRKNEKTEKFLYYIDVQTPSAQYVGVEAGSVKACTTTCREELVVSFGPPRAVIAGQCFTYEVEIKSKVNCISNLELNNLPDINKYIPNDLIPICNSARNHENQAGPNEDFDKCIASCDGGKYSQSCIDKCYTKVYETKKTKKEQAEAKKNSFDSYKESTLALKVRASDDDSACPAEVRGAVNANLIVAVYNYAQKTITGNFNGLNYFSKNAACKWNNYAPFYFNSLQLTARTVCNDNGYNWYLGNTDCQYGARDAAYYDACMNDGNCMEGKYRRKHYEDREVKVGTKCTKHNKKGVCIKSEDVYETRSVWTGTYDYNAYAGVNGFKKEDGCNDNCQFNVSGGRYYSDREQAENDYVNNALSYFNEAIGCINNAAAACHTDYATYQMTVNYDQDNNKQTCALGSNDKNCKTWDATGNKVLPSNESNTSILISNGGSCSNRDDYYMYHDILTFPGAWINNKNGDVVYNKPSNTNWYTYKEGNYCTPLNAKNVNAPYWRWYQNTKSGVTTKSFDEWAGSEYIKSIVYNINSSIKNFGHYNWNFDTACFYAISDSTDTGCPDGVCSSCTNEACPPGNGTSTNINNFSSKSYTSSNIFPSGTSSDKKEATVKKLSGVEKQAGSTASSSASRAEGFNWSVKATNLSIKGYPVTPSALVKKIEATDAYTNTELDYDITLTTTNLRNIRNDANRNSSKNYYTSYSDGTFTNVKGTGYETGKYDNSNTPNYTYYKSSFLRNDSYTSKRLAIPGSTGLPCNNLLNSTTCDLTLSGFVTSDQDLIEWLR